MMGLSARLRQVRACLALAVVLAMAALWLGMPRGLSLRAVWERWGWSILLAGFGVRISVEGDPADRAILVANHVSWLDIAVLARAAPCSFVARADMAAWPVIGRLAARHGCVFVARDGRGGVGRQVEAMAAALRRARRLVLFPEGTTGPGHAVLPFRPSLLAVAGQGGHPVQPVAIRYRRHPADGCRTEALRSVAWLGDAALLPHALALAAHGPVLADIVFCPVRTGDCRKRLAEQSRAEIMARLVWNRGAGGPPAPVRPPG